MYPPQGVDIPNIGSLYFRKSGRYFGSAIGAAMAAVSRNTDTLFAIPFIVVKDESFDSIAIEVTIAGAAGKLVRLGVYNNQTGQDPVPGSLLVDAGTALIDSTGVKEIPISVNLTKGLYWLAYLANDTVTVRGSSVDSAISQVLGLPAASFASIARIYSSALAFAALPDPFPAGPTFENLSPFVYIKKV